MKVLSLFDGISCGQIALERVGIEVEKYYASEIKPIAIKCTQANYPNTIQIGNVTEINVKTLEKIDLLIGGSPCQDLLRARVMSKNGQDGLNGDKSGLMKEKDKKLISDILGVEPIKINSNLVSYQNRSRYYWTNIPNVIQPEDKHINFQDYIEKDYEKCKEFKVKKTPSRIKMWGGWR